MKLSYEWVKEYVKTSVSPEKMAEGLTMSGSEVGEMTKAGKDTVMELEITSNRPDCLSVIGLAREISAVFDADLTLPSFGPVQEKGAKKIKCVIQNKQLCPLYTARVIENITVSGTCKKITDRITAVGMRGVNNIVDITNYCLLETGQPMHAFDLDKIEGSAVYIREAAENEKITTIDGMDRTLKKGMLVIADEKGPIAVAGVMGGKRTEVGERTVNILLESAYFDPLSIRRTSRELGISTDSSYRFERGVDKGMVEKASARASALILKETGGTASPLSAEGSVKSEMTIIKFRVPEAGRILGMTLTTRETGKIFQRLGMTVKKEEKDVLFVEAPTFRGDIAREVDLIEEAARIYGYEKIPSEIKKMIPQVTRKQRGREVQEKIKQIMTRSGFSEIMTYSLISVAASGRFAMISGDEVSLINPLSEEQKVLTPQLIDGMMKTISWNLNRNSRDLILFEIGKVYAPGKNGFLETAVLCASMTGSARNNWAEGNRKAGLYDLKGALEALFDGLSVPPVFKKTRIEGMVNCADIHIGESDEKEGFIAEIGYGLSDAYGISQKVYVCHVRLDTLTAKAVLDSKYVPIAKFPSSDRDISILCARETAAEEIKKIICRAGGPAVKGVAFKDIYEGEQVPAGKKSLTYGIKYGSDDKTLTDAETESVHGKIKEALIKTLGVSFR
ncbi:MAG: phenylalanine--tRNA ligase subunit beta [Candidatus Omnitrophota bacterium]|nr:phenylalanine--tRNA ligase subunit beta [Candidatus Omnitrophota bacterium]